MTDHTSTYSPQNKIPNKPLQLSIQNPQRTLRNLATIPSLTSPAASPKNPNLKEIPSPHPHRVYRFQDTAALQKNPNRHGAPRNLHGSKTAGVFPLECRLPREKQHGPQTNSRKSKNSRIAVSGTSNLRNTRVSRARRSYGVQARVYGRSGGVRLPRGTSSEARKVAAQRLGRSCIFIRRTVSQRSR